MRTERPVSFDDARRAHMLIQHARHDFETRMALTYMGLYTVMWVSTELVEWERRRGEYRRAGDFATVAVFSMFTAVLIRGLVAPGEEQDDGRQDG